ncbi:MAG: lipopolysaccharide biosynthesis protein, partial [Pedobacter sp.]
SGIISFILCAGILFVIFWFDKSITSVNELRARVNQPILGELDHMDNNADLKDVWTTKELSPSISNFKNQMRSIRFEIKKDLLYKKDKVLGITSINSGEGKTFFSLSLAYSFAMLNKKVLIIDGNFDKPDLSDSISSKIFIEDYIKNKFLPTDSLITILANRGGDFSLFEMIEEQNIAAFFEELKSKFDIIVVDTTSLRSLNKAKEWLMYTDKHIGVFKYGETFTENKNKYADYLNANGNYLGWVFNNVKREQKSSFISLKG